MRNSINRLLILLTVLLPLTFLLTALLGFKSTPVGNFTFSLSPIISGLAFLVLMHRKFSYIDGVSTFKKYIIGNLLFDSFIIGGAFLYGVVEGGGEAFMLAMFSVPYVVIINILALVDVGVVAILRKRKEN